MNKYIGGRMSGKSYLDDEKLTPIKMTYREFKRRYKRYGKTYKLGKNWFRCIYIKNGIEYNIEYDNISGIK